MKFTMNKRLSLLPLLLIALGGCGSTSQIHPSASSKSEFEGAVYSGETVDFDKRTPGAELYRLFQQGASGFVPLSAVRSDVQDLAKQFCENKGKTIHQVQETHSTPPHILGNFPRVELLFECIDAPTKESLVSVAPLDTITQIERLKKLLDSGALTQQEFDEEKAKILSRQ